MQVTPLQGAGAEIRGVNLANLDDANFDTVRQVFSDYGLVFFRDQNLTEQDQIDFAQRWGPINVNRFFTAHETHPEIAMVTKEPDQTVNIGGGWHTDHSYDLEPALGSMLLARELPTTGGDTWFVSMFDAYNGLSEGLKQTLRGLRAVHSAKHVFGTSAGYAEQQPREGKRIGNPEAADVLTDPVHPVVIRHPISGRESLYVNPGFTLRFEGWTPEESRPLLDYLFSQAIAEERICKFKWEPGSMAFWDNRATWHFAQNDYDGQRREMHRITIEGCALESA